MAEFPESTSYVFNTFKGIRTRNGIAAGGTISATVCQNIDFAPSSYDAGVLINTTKGNYKTALYTSSDDLYAWVYQTHTIYTKTTTITASTDLYDAEGNANTDTDWDIAEVDNSYVIQYDGHDSEYSAKDNIYEFSVIKGFETVQEGDHHQLFYVENSTIGRVVEFNPSGGTFTTLVDNLTKTGEANGITLIDGAYDVFVFTNGIEYYSIQLYPTTTTTQLSPEYDGNPVTGLALCEQDGSLVIGCNEGIVLASRKGGITDFDYVTPTDTNKPWYQLFGKKVTAVVPYIDALLVFTEEDSTVLSGNMSDASSATREDASLGGCMSFESWCKHDKYLFFYDNRQKNIYYYMQNNYGQKVLGEPIAPEVQKFFNNVERLQMVSYIGNNRSEIWLLSNNFKLIYDYYIGEWTERVCQDLTSYFVYDNNVYSTGGAKCFKEKSGNVCLFDGVYYPAKYSMQLINLGSFSNMKEMEIQPLFTVTSDYNNTFYVDCLINGRKTKTKYLKMYAQGAVWADDEPQDEGTPDNELWDVQIFPSENDALMRQIKAKFISNWYYLQFTIRTEAQGDEFSITCFEIKGISQEIDTTGQK